jgi:hypothetical protein
MRLVYGKDVEDNALWFQQVIVAKAVAAKVLDLPASDPKELLSGRGFIEAGVLGAVESDFFDWVLASERGCDLV